jgi:hypothetical protein
MFIEEGDPIVSKSYMTRVEGESSRLRLAALLGTVAPQEFVLLQVGGDVEVFTPLAADL